MATTMLKRIADGISRRAGIDIQRTYLYHTGTADSPVAVPSDDQTQWSQISVSQIECLQTVGFVSPSTARLRLDRGDRCYGAFLDGGLAHYCWVQDSGAHSVFEAGLRLAVDQGDFWIYHCRTAECARGRHLYPANLIRILKDYFLAGARAGWIYTSSGNIASQKGILRAGFQQVATLEAIRVGSRYFALPRRLDATLPRRVREDKNGL
jgi:hypothetical protein